MDHISMEMLSFLLGAGFVAAFIDSVVGGGGLISMPALLMTGLPPNIVLGTNKLASICCSSTSSISFLRSGKMDLGLVKYLFPLSLIGSILGAYTVRLIPPEFLKPLVVVMLVLVAIYTVFKKDWGDKSTYKGIDKRVGILGGCAAFILGFYDGFFGPGAGSFLIFVFLMLGFDFVVAAGNAKALNLASNLGAVATFLLADSVNYVYGISMGIAMIIGAIVGSRFAISKGAAYVKPLFISVTTFLIGKQLWDVLH
ncbi:sulfite exporter TauE/SafE family protein [Pelosinus sp. sgz500959]|uniref:sulfite exporter TauE/SafE family protein n=1 Tax=Pelosinus sp. sgz500959 TaxID=3242472 RepID=UPI00366C9828